jgi:hypothetical protein
VSGRNRQAWTCENFGEIEGRILHGVPEKRNLPEKIRRTNPARGKKKISPENTSFPVI